MKLSDKCLAMEGLEQTINLEKSSNRDLERQLNQFRENCVALRSQLDAATDPSESHEAEMNSLKTRINELNELANMEIQRGATIVKRYERGDLTEGERELIVIVQKAGQSLHEQQIIAKENEIRQRGNVVKNLEKRKAELEDQLAKQLRKQAMANEGVKGSKSLASNVDGATTEQEKTLAQEKAGSEAASPTSPNLSKVAKAPKKATYSSSSSKAAKSKNANSGKGVTFADLNRSASGDEDDDFNNSEVVELSHPASSKKRTHKAMENEQDARRNAPPLRRSRTTNIDSPSPSKEDQVEPKMKSRKRR